MSSATEFSTVEYSSSFRSVKIAKTGNVAEVVLIGPGKGNSMGPDFWREMPRAFELLDADPEVRAILIYGDGKTFSYGLDLPAMMTEPGFSVGTKNLAAERTALLDMVLKMQTAISCVAETRKPVIAAIHGWCIGAGLDLISAADIRLASLDAKFSLREVKVAIVADMGSLQRLPLVIGESHTRELALTGRDIDAQYAYKIGLVTEVFESYEELLEAARKKANEIASNPPLVVQGIKRVMNEARDKQIGDGLRYVALWNSAFLHSTDLVEAMTAFQQKRPPKFKGE
jgi:enoyl-CoA hydratase